MTETRQSSKEGSTLSSICNWVRWWVLDLPRNDLSLTENYAPPLVSSSEPPNCPICRRPSSWEPSVMVNCCSHILQTSVHFHQMCVGSLDHVSWTCPVCRRLESINFVPTIDEAQRARHAQLRRFWLLMRFAIKGFSMGLNHLILPRFLLADAGGSPWNFVHFVLYLKAHLTARFLSGPDWIGDLALGLMSTLLTGAPLSQIATFVFLRRACGQLDSLQKEIKFRRELSREYRLAGRSESVICDVLVAGWGFLSGLLLTRQNLFVYRLFEAFASARHHALSRLTSR